MIGTVEHSQRNITTFFGVVSRRGSLLLIGTYGLSMANHSALNQTKSKSVKALAGHCSITLHSRMIRVEDSGRALPVSDERYTENSRTQIRKGPDR